MKKVYMSKAIAYTFLPYNLDCFWSLTWYRQSMIYICFIGENGSTTFTYCCCLLLVLLVVVDSEGLDLLLWAACPTITARVLEVDACSMDDDC